MAITRWKSNLYVPGTIACGYVSDVAGTAYMVTTGSGSAYKMIGGTGQLVGGSLAITPALSVIYGAVANYIAGTSTTAMGTHLGTVGPLLVKFAATGAGGTAAILSRPSGSATVGGAIEGTAIVSWVAFGY